MPAYKSVLPSVYATLAMQCTHCARSAVTVRERANMSNVFCDSQCQTAYYAKANAHIGSGILLWLKDVSPSKSAEYGRDLFFAEFLKYTPADAAALLEVLAQPTEDTRVRRQQIEEWLRQRADWRAQKVFKAAVARGYARAVAFLVTRHFVDIDAPIFDIYRDQNVPAIEYAASITGSAKIVRILVQLGAAAARAFYWAARDGRSDVIRTLIEIGNPDIDARDAALLVAAENEHPDAVRVLLDTETSAKARNDALRLASDEWIESKTLFMPYPVSWQIVRMLLDARANPYAIRSIIRPKVFAALDIFQQEQEAAQKRQRIRQRIQ